jgi:hypothetical protein
VRPALLVPAGDNSNLAERIERRPRAHTPVPSWQFDRGRFENYLGEQNDAAGIDLFPGSFITNVEVGIPTASRSSAAAPEARSRRSRRAG